MERRPALVVSSVDVSAVRHQELHHVEIVIDTRLGNAVSVSVSLGLNKQEPVENTWQRKRADGSMTFLVLRQEKF